MYRLPLIHALINLTLFRRTQLNNLNTTYYTVKQLDVPYRLVKHVLRGESGPFKGWIVSGRKWESFGLDGSLKLSVNAHNSGDEAGHNAQGEITCAPHAAIEQSWRFCFSPRSPAAVRELSFALIVSSRLQPACLFVAMIKAVKQPKSTWI